MKTEKSRLISEAAPQPATSISDISGNEFATIVPVISGQIGGRETNIVSAKALHKTLGVGRDYSTWLSDRIKDYGFELGVDYVVFDSPTLRNQSTENSQSASGWKTKRGGDRRSKDTGLSLGMAKELAMVERNEHGRAVRRYFIQCEEALQRSVPEIAAQYRRQLKARLSAANMFKPMCAALDAARAEQGKQTLHRHYSNESNMISRIVLGGLTAKQWAQVNGIAGEARDAMNAVQLEHLTYLEGTNTTLIDMGMAYDQRKAELVRLSQRWMTKRLGADHD
ncbi:antA/AntB antirepressor family protein [Lonsdalea britannica]|uniref:AntA/AntB antirepressor family protein n=1 Tax=Lonsdalea britannica TaxID=1082704 RepID=A0AAD0WJC5_9GAMM|nr:antA/AntB antirepressor family protein [Lonsdalea britannica]AXW85759.1 antA/AntB antirepressor family protein [Lonsdalea britannica]OSM95510.1 antA/AntB antirepressor family protein [Lonsdalea britannica]